MLCGQRGFFLSSTQYEAVILEFVNTRNGIVTYKFSKIEEVDGFAIYTRISTDGAQTWQSWQRQDMQIVGNPATFAIQYTQGIICEAYVVVIGDGTREQSDPSNIITTIVPREPALSPPIIRGYPFYYDGRTYPTIVHDYIPTGVSAWAMWYRQIANSDWSQFGVVSGKYRIFNNNIFEMGLQYQFRTAWASNDGQYLLSDLSNMASITLPLAAIQYLLPVIRVESNFYRNPSNNKYYNHLLFMRGDMRDVSIYVEYRRSIYEPRTWTPLSGGSAGIPGEYSLAELGMDVATQTSGSLYFGYSDGDAYTGEVWQYRIKNRATGLQESEWSEIFEVTVPSLLPRLETPTIRFNQIGSNVIVSWDSVDYAAGYRLERKLMEDVDFTVISDTIPSSWTSYEDSTTQTGNTYVYRLTAKGDYAVYQDSLPAEDHITVDSGVVLQPPVLSNLAESGIDITMTVSNLDGANSRTTYIEMSEDNGAWQQVGFVNVESVAVTSVNTTIVGEKILNGGVLRFRAYQSGMGIYEDSDYSEIVSITIDHREWLLRWNGTSWDDPSGTTGGWMNQTTTDSEGTHVSNITETSPSVGVKRLQGAGWYRTVNTLTENNASLRSKYSRICMVGTLVKQVDGQDNHAWFGDAFIYPFMGGWNFDTLNADYEEAGRGSRHEYAGTLTNPVVYPYARHYYANDRGAYLFFHFYNGYADVRGILGIKQE